MSAETSKFSISQKLDSGEYVLKEFHGKSDVWKDFTQVCAALDSKEYQGFVACKKCSMLFAFRHGSTGTSTFKRHLMKCATVTKPKESSAKQPKILKYCNNKTI